MAESDDTITRMAERIAELAAEIHVLKHALMTCGSLDPDVIVPDEDALWRFERDSTLHFLRAGPGAHYPPSH